MKAGPKLAVDEALNEPGRGGEGPRLGGRGAPGVGAQGCGVQGRACLLRAWPAGLGVRARVGCAASAWWAQVPHGGIPLPRARKTGW